MGKINQLSIEFNEEKFIYDLCDKLINCVTETLGRIEAEMRFLAKSNTVKSSIKSEFDSYRHDLVNYGFSLIEGKVGSTSWKSFIEQYGTGSKMNPVMNVDFEWYRSSIYWNPARQGKAVVGRPEGEYDTLDWESVDGGTVTKYSSGNYEGQNLEELKTKMPNGGMARMFTPQEPNEFMSNAMIRVHSDFEKSLVNIMKSINLNKYLITGK